MRVLLTRPAGRGSRFAERLRAAGHEVGHCPLTRIVDGDRFPDPAPFDGVLFTSVSAVERAPAGVQWPRVGAVGEATASALRERGIPVAVRGSGGGAALAQAWKPRPGERLLLPQAEQAHPSLAAALRDAGAMVTIAAVYRTAPLVDVDPGPFEKADVVCFFAPSAVRAYLALPVRRRARCWGVGETTRQAVLEGTLDLFEEIL